MFCGLALAGLGGLTLYGLDQVETLRGELANTRHERAMIETRRQNAHERLSQLAEGTREKEAAAAALAQKASAQGAAALANEKLIADLRRQLDGRDGEVSSDANRIRVDLVDQILFASGDAELSMRGQKILGKVGAVLKDLDDKQILIGGHTDDRPIHNERFPSNWELSAARAVNVARYLTESAGVDPRKVAAAAYSEFHPRSRNNAPKNRARNRRIEILLTPVVTVKKA
jgi:chemotaxis protein MotB